MQLHSKIPDIVFIIGVGRSGTSLLQSILSSHSQVCIVPETGFLRRVVFSFKTYTPDTCKQAVSLYPRLERIESTFNDNHSLVFNNTIDLYLYFLECYRRQQSKKIVGDKDPRLIEYIDAACQLFPKAKFIHIVRDPRDVLLSKKRASWSKKRHSLFHIFANYVQVKLGELMGQQLGEGCYHRVIYEKLVQYPEAVVSNVCEVLGIEFEKSMLHFQEKGKELIFDDEIQWKKETTGPLLKANFGKWKGNLAKWEVVLTELLCNQTFRIGGYVKSDVAEEISAFQLNILLACSVLIRGAGNIYAWYRLGYQKVWLLWKT